MGGFERRKELSREKILNAAEALFMKHGFNKVSMNEIARKAGVSKVTIYHLFDSKEQLIHSSVEIFGNRIIERMQEILKTAKPYPEKLEDLLNYMLEMSEANPGHSDIDFQCDPQLSEPHLKQMMDRLMEQIVRLFVEFIREGQRHGYLNPDLSEEAIKAHIVVFIQGMIANPDIHARVHHNTKLAHDMFVIMLYGFAKIR